MLLGVFLHNLVYGKDCEVKILGKQATLKSAKHLGKGIIKNWKSKRLLVKVRATKAQKNKKEKEKDSKTLRQSTTFNYFNYSAI